MSNWEVLLGKSLFWAGFGFGHLSSLPPTADVCSLPVASRSIHYKAVLSPLPSSQPNSCPISGRRGGGKPWEDVCCSSELLCWWEKCGGWPSISEGPSGWTCPVAIAILGWPCMSPQGSLWECFLAGLSIGMEAQVFLIPDPQTLWRVSLPPTPGVGLSISHPDQWFTLLFFFLFYFRPSRSKVSLFYFFLNHLSVKFGGRGIFT